MREVEGLFKEVEAAARRLEAVARRTPILRSDALDRLAGCEVYLKAEVLQRTGSFKFRGAYNAVSTLSGGQRRRGVVTYSSGNHAQAVACAAALLDTRAVVVMPEDAPRMKVDATRSYGADIVFHDRNGQDRAELAASIATDRQLTLVPPYDDAAVVAGQGTVALELIEDAPPLDVLMVCVSGGGLLAGCAITSRVLQPQLRVIGVEPWAMPRTARSFAAGRPVTVPALPTIADALQARTPGKLTFPINMGLVDGMLSATDDEMLSAVTTVYDHVKVAVEPSGACALAGLLAHRPDFEGLRVGVTLSGGNVSLDELIALRDRSSHPTVRS